MSLHLSLLSSLVLTSVLSLAVPVHSEPPISERTWEHRLADAQFALAARSFEAKDDREGLARLGAALRLDPSHWQARYRLHSFLTQRRYALPLSEWSVPDPFTAELSPNGKVLLTVNQENVATLWNPQTGQSIGHPLKIADVYSGYPAYFALAGNFLVARIDADHLLLIDTKTGVPVAKLTGMKSVEFSEKGRHAFVELQKPRGSLIRAVWNVSSGQLQDLGLPPEEEVSFAHFTQDEEKLIIALRAPKSKILRVIIWPGPATNAKGHPAVTISTDEKPNFISADGEIIGFRADPAPLFGGRTAREAWSTATGLPVPFSKGMDGWMRSLDSFFGFEQDRGNFATNADGKFGVATALDGTARIDEIREDSTSSSEAPKPPGMPPLPHPFRLGAVAFWPDGAGVVTVEHPSQGKRPVAVRNWVLTSPPRVAEIQGLEYDRVIPAEEDPAKPSLFAARFLPGGDAIVLFFRDGTMRIWKPWHSLLPGPTLPIPKSPYLSQTAFSEVGAVMAIPLAKNELMVWDFAERAPLLAPISRQSSPNGADFLPFALNRDGHYLAATNYDPSADKRTVSIWDTTAHRLVRTLPIDTWGSLTLSGDGRRLASDPKQPDEVPDGVVIFDVETGRPLTAPLRTMVFPPHVVLNCDGTAVTFGCDPLGGHNNLSPWIDLLNLSHLSPETTEWQSLRTVEFLSGEASAFSPDGKMLAAAPRGEDLWVFRTDNGQPSLGPLGALGRTGEDIDSVAFSPDGRLLASHSKSGVVVRDAATGLPVTQLLPGHEEFYIDSIHFDSTGTKLLVVGEKLDYFDLAAPVNEDSADLATLAEGIAGQQVDLNTDRLQFLDSLPVITQLRAKHPDWSYFQVLKARATPPQKK